MQCETECIFHRLLDLYFFFYFLHKILRVENRGKLKLCSKVRSFEDFEGFKTSSLEGSKMCTDGKDSAETIRNRLNFSLTSWRGGQNHHTEEKCVAEFLMMTRGIPSTLAPTSETSRAVSLVAKITPAAGCLLGNFRECDKVPLDFYWWHTN